jgi:hypothetical protein
MPGTAGVAPTLPRRTRGRRQSPPPRLAPGVSKTAGMGETYCSLR